MSTAAPTSSPVATAPLNHPYLGWQERLEWRADYARPERHKRKQTQHLARNENDQERREAER